MIHEALQEWGHAQERKHFRVLPAGTATIDNLLTPESLTPRSAAKVCCCTM